MTTRIIEAFIPGIVYLRPAPGAAPFKQPGDRIAAGDKIGLIEVMKSFMPVEAESAGRLIRFLVENEDTVDVGQPICEIETEE